MVDNELFCIFCGNYVPRSEVDGAGKHVGSPLECHFVTGIRCLGVRPPVLSILQLTGEQFGFDRLASAQAGDEEIWTNVGLAIHGRLSIDDLQYRLPDRANLGSFGAYVMASANIVHTDLEAVGTVGPMAGSGPSDDVRPAGLAKSVAAFVETVREINDVSSS